MPPVSLKTPAPGSGKSSKRKRVSDGKISITGEAERMSEDRRKRRTTMTRASRFSHTMEANGNAVMNSVNSESPLMRTIPARPTSSVGTRYDVHRNSESASNLQRNPVPADPVTATFELHKQLRSLLNPYAGPLELDLTKLTEGVFELLRTCSTLEIAQQQERDMSSLQKLVAEQGADVWAEVTSLQMQCQAQHEEQRKLYERFQERQKHDMKALMNEIRSLKHLLTQRDMRLISPAGKESSPHDQPHTTKLEPRYSSPPIFGQSSKAYKGHNVAPLSQRAAMHPGVEIYRSNGAGVSGVQPKRSNSMLENVVTAVVQKIKNIGRYMFTYTTWTSEDDQFHSRYPGNKGTLDTARPIEANGMANDDTGYMLRSRVRRMKHDKD